MDIQLEGSSNCDDLQDYEDLLRQYPPDISFKGGTRKIGNLPKACNHKEHNPPTHQHFAEGVYEHYCPACGKRKVFIVKH